MADLKPTFHHLDHSSSQRILWLLEELEIPYNLVLHTRGTNGADRGKAPPDIKLIHPMGKSPMLETGDRRVIIETLVIAKYLIDTYDTHGKFKGDANNDALRDDTLSNIASASMGPFMFFTIILDQIVALSPFFIRPVIRALNNALQKLVTMPEINLCFQYFEEQLGQQDYFMGSHPGKADFVISWPMDVCTQRKYIDLTKYPRLAAWHQRCHTRPAWGRCLEKGNGYNLKWEETQ